VYKHSVSFSISLEQRHQVFNHTIDRLHEKYVLRMRRVDVRLQDLGRHYWIVILYATAKWPTIVPANNYTITIRADK
jgi:hypothetical protein